MSSSPQNQPITGLPLSHLPAPLSQRNSKTASSLFKLSLRALNDPAARETLAITARASSFATPVFDNHENDSFDIWSPKSREGDVNFSSSVCDCPDQSPRGRFVSVPRAESPSLLQPSPRMDASPYRISNRERSPTRRRKYDASPSKYVSSKATVAPVLKSCQRREYKSPRTSRTRFSSMEERVDGVNTTQDNKTILTSDEPESTIKARSDLETLLNELALIRVSRIRMKSVQPSLYPKSIDKFEEDLLSSVALAAQCAAQSHPTDDGSARSLLAETSSLANVVGEAEVTVPGSRCGQAAITVREAVPQESARTKLIAAAPNILQASDATAVKGPLPLLPISGIIKPRKRTPQESINCDRSVPLKNSRVTILPYVESKSHTTDDRELQHFMNELERIRDRNNFRREMATIDDDKEAAHFLAKLLCSACHVSKIKLFMEVKGHDLLLELMKKNQKDPNIFSTILAALAQGADMDAELRDFCVRHVLPCVDESEAAKSSQAAAAYIDLVIDARFRKRMLNPNNIGDNDILKDSKRCDKFIHQCKANGVSFGGDHLDLIDQVLPRIKTELTLQEIHGQLNHRRLLSETLIMSESRAMRRLFDFIMDATEVYFKSTIDDVSSFLGQEIMFGCLSVQLLSSFNQNSFYMIHHQVPQMLLRCMATQQHEQVMQHAVLTAVDMCASGGLAMAQTFSAAANAPSIIVDVVRRGRVATEHSAEWEMDDLLIPRLQLVRDVAINTKVFADTTMCEELITVWENSDLNFYGRIRFLESPELEKMRRAEQRDMTLRNIGSVLLKGVPGVAAEGPVILNVSPLQRRRSSVQNTQQLQRRLSSSPTQEKRGLLSRTLTRRGRTPSPAFHSLPTKEMLSRRASMMRSKASSSRAAVPRPDLSGSFDSIVDIGIWHGDDDTVGPVIMQPLMQTFRKKQVAQRLIGLIIDQETNPAALPDILFLVGTLSSDPELRLSFGELKAVQRILDLIRRAYKHEGLYVSEVVGNSCLALANLCVLCVPNTKRFEKHRGTELLVVVLTTRGKMNDANSVNGVAAAMCNLCFKNEDMKKALGIHGACQALTQAMSDYKSREGAAGSREVPSLFKAIGNLSLNAKNMQFFIQADIHHAYVTFLDQADDELDDTSLEASLKTLANLVIEKDNMELFAVSLVSLLALIRRTRKTTLELYCWAFETIGNLCRLPSSAALFTINEGIQTIFSLLSYLPESSLLQSRALFVLGVQTSDKSNIPILVNEGIFQFCKQILDNFCLALTAADGNMNDTTVPPVRFPIDAIRCLWRVVVTPTYAREFVEAGCQVTLLKMFPLIYSKQMLLYETLKLMFRLIEFNSDGETTDLLLATHSPPGRSPAKLAKRASLVSRATMNFQTKATQLANVAAAMRSVPAGGSSVRKLQDYGYSEEDLPRKRVPLGERAWERLKLTRDDIEMLIITVRKGLAHPKASRDLTLIRIGLGLLAYFACEKQIDPLYQLIVCDDDELTTTDVRPSKTNVTESNQRPSFSSLFRVRQKKESEHVIQDGFGHNRPNDKTSVLDIILNALKYFSTDTLVLEETIILLIHITLCPTTIEEAHIVADHNFYQEVKTLAFKDDVVLNHAKEFLPLYKLFLEKGPSINTEEFKQFYRLLDLEFPLELSGCNNDPFPEGVQSLPSPLKTFIRTGGLFEVYRADVPNKMVFDWKASHDLRGSRFISFLKQRVKWLPITDL